MTIIEGSVAPSNGSGPPTPSAMYDGSQVTLTEGSVAFPNGSGPPAPAGMYDGSSQMTLTEGSAAPPNGSGPPTPTPAAAGRRVDVPAGVRPGLEDAGRPPAPAAAPPGVPLDPASPGTAMPEPGAAGAGVDPGRTTIVVAEARSLSETSVTVVSEQTVTGQVRRLMEQINRAPTLTMSTGAQEELARIVKLLPDLVGKNDPYLADAAALAVTGLMEGEPSLAFARSVRREIESSVSRWKRPMRAMYRGRPPMRATLGLLLFVGIGSVVLTLLAWVATVGWWPEIDGVDGGLLGVSAAMGGLGSIISIFVRVPHMSEDFRSTDPEVPFFVGLLKPMVGIAFAAFSFVAIEGGLLPISIDTTNKAAFFMAISFVAGFSERFVPDIIDKAEGSADERSADPRQLRVQAPAPRTDPAAGSS